MKYIFSLLLLGLTMVTAVAQTSAQKARQKEIQTAYSLAMEGIKQQAEDVDPVSNVNATVKRMEAAVGVVTYKDEFYTSLPEQQSFFRCRRSQGGRSLTSTEALFNSSGRVVFYFEKSVNEETRIYWNNDGTLSMTLQKASTNSKQVIDKLNRDEIKSAKNYAERSYANYMKLVESGRFDEEN